METQSVNTLPSNVDANRGEHFDPQDDLGELRRLVIQALQVHEKTKQDCLMDIELESLYPCLSCCSNIRQVRECKQQGMPHSLARAVSSPNVAWTTVRSFVDQSGKAVAHHLAPPVALRFPLELSAQLVDRLRQAQEREDKTLPEHCGNQMGSLSANDHKKSEMITGSLEALSIDGKARQPDSCLPHNSCAVCKVATDRLRELQNRQTAQARQYQSTGARMLQHPPTAADFPSGSDLLGIQAFATSDGGLEYFVMFGVKATDTEFNANVQALAPLGRG